MYSNCHCASQVPLQIPLLAVWMGSTWLASDLCLSNDYPHAFPRHLRNLPWRSLLCFQSEMNFAKRLCSIMVCSFQDPTCDLKDSVSLAPDSKRIFHCKTHLNACRLTALRSPRLSRVPVFYNVIACMTLTRGGGGGGILN